MVLHDNVIKWKQFPRHWPFTPTGEFHAQRSVTRIFDVFFDLRLNKRLSKQSRRCRNEAPLRSFWRHCNEGCYYHRQDHTVAWASWHLKIIDNSTVSSKACHFNIKQITKAPHYWSMIRETTDDRRRFDVFLDLRLNQRLTKQRWGWWFETLSRPLWRHCNVKSACQLWSVFDLSPTVTPYSD